MIKTDESRAIFIVFACGLSFGIWQKSVWSGVFMVNLLLVVPLLLRIGK